jgi:hypothetical protein
MQMPTQQEAGSVATQTGGSMQKQQPEGFAQRLVFSMTASSRKKDMQL